MNPIPQSRPTSIEVEKVLVCFSHIRQEFMASDNVASDNLKPTQSTDTGLVSLPRATLSEDWIGGEHVTDIMNPILSHLPNKQELFMPVKKLAERQ